MRNNWLTREDRLYQPLLFTASKSDLAHRKVNDFLNKWDKINIVDIEDDNINNAKNELRGYFNVYNKEIDPFFKLVKCDKSDTSIENNVHSWPVIISSQVVNDATEKDRELEIKDVPSDKRDTEIKVTEIPENDNTTDNDITLNNEREGSVRSTMSSVSSCEDIKYHLLICVHGFLGNKYDLYTVRDYFERYVNNSEKNRGKMKYVYLLSKINQDNTYLDIESESQKLYEEIEEFMIKKNIKFTYISFVCHSMGGLIARSLIAKTEFIKYWSVLHSFISLSVPHVGMRLKNPFFSLCFKSFLKISSRKKKTSLDQLAVQDESDIKNCYIYRLSEKKNLELFKYVHLISVTQDGYVPQYSSLIMPKKEENSASQKFIKDVYRNIFTPIFKEKVYRNKYFNNYMNQNDEYYNNGGTSSLCDSRSSSLDFVSCNNSASDLPSRYQSCSSLNIPISDPQSPNFSLSQSPITSASNYDQDNASTNTNSSNININGSNHIIDTNNIINDCISSLSHLQDVANLSAESLNDTTANKRDPSINTTASVINDNNNIDNNNNNNINSNNNTSNENDNSSNTNTNTNTNNINVNNINTNNTNTNNTNINNSNINNTNSNNDNGGQVKNNIDKTPIINYTGFTTKNDTSNEYDGSSEDDDNKKINLNTFVSSIRNTTVNPRRSSKPVNHNLVTPKTKVFRYNIHYRTLETDLLGRTGHIQTLREMFVIRMLFTLINHQVEKINLEDTF